MIFSKHFWDGYMSFIFPFGMLAAYFCVGHLNATFSGVAQRFLRGVTLAASVAFVIAILP